MSDDLHNRVGGLEQWQARTDERIEHIEEGVGETRRGVRELLDRDARRPEPASVKTVFYTVVTIVAGCGVLGGLVWWLVATAPAVMMLDRRVTELDHPRVGRVPMIERKVRVLGGWQARVVRKKSEMRQN